jgi:hypothetical protein
MSGMLRWRFSALIRWGPLAVMVASTAMFSTQGEPLLHCR